MPLSLDETWNIFLFFYFMGSGYVYVRLMEGGKGEGRRGGRINVARRFWLHKTKSKGGGRGGTGMGGRGKRETGRKTKKCRK